MGNTRVQGHGLQLQGELVISGDRGSPVAGHFSCAAKKSNQKKATPGVAPRVRGVTLCCLSRCGDCATRPGKAHTTCLAMGLEQCSSTSPHRDELLGAPQGEPTAFRPSSNTRKLVQVATIRSNYACPLRLIKKGRYLTRFSPCANLQNPTASHLEKGILAYRQPWRPA